MKKFKNLTKIFGILKICIFHNDYVDLNTDLKFKI